MVSPPLVVPATSRLPSGTVAPIRQAALADRLTLRRVCHGMVMVVTGRLVRPPPSGFDGLFRRMGRDEAIAAVADEVGPSRLDQRFPHREVILRLEELHERSLHLAVFHSLGDIHFLPGKRI